MPQTYRFFAALAQQSKGCRIKGLRPTERAKHMARVLVVEDHVILRYALAHWLRERDMRF